MLGVVEKSNIEKGDLFPKIIPRFLYYTLSPSK